MTKSFLAQRRIYRANSYIFLKMRVAESGMIL
jgi:hypothetical protein